MDSLHQYRLPTVQSKYVSVSTPEPEIGGDGLGSHAEGNGWGEFVQRLLGSKISN